MQRKAAAELVEKLRKEWGFFHQHLVRRRGHKVTIVTKKERGPVSINHDILWQWVREIGIRRDLNTRLSMTGDAKRLVVSFTKMQRRKR